MFSFNNCGKKIKITAEVLKWLALVAGLILTIVGIVNMTSSRSAQVAAGTTMLIIGLTLVITSWIGSLCLYGFGIIVEAHERQLAVPSHKSSVVTGLAAPVTPPAPVASKVERSVQPLPADPADAPRPAAMPVEHPKETPRVTPQDKVAYALRFSTDEGMKGYLQSCRFEEPVHAEIASCLSANNVRAALTEWLHKHE